jgi:hypothetical protein
MKYIRPLKHKKTSVSLPYKSYRRLCAARKIFARNGIHYSNQEIYRRLLKEFLKNWRGRGRKTNSLRRYNATGKDYGIHALYINQVLYAALWQRALHSGESVSRMLDVAIRVYLPRLLESLLGSTSGRNASTKNSLYWASRYHRRKYQYPGFFINYTCHTQSNDANTLDYTQNMQIISKTGLSAMQIWDLLHRAA